MSTDLQSRMRAARGNFGVCEVCGESKGPEDVGRVGHHGCGGLRRLCYSCGEAIRKGEPYYQGLHGFAHDACLVSAATMVRNLRSESSAAYAKYENWKGGAVVTWLPPPYPKHKALRENRRRLLVLPTGETARATQEVRRALSDSENVVLCGSFLFLEPVLREVSATLPQPHRAHVGTRRILTWLGFAHSVVAVESLGEANELVRPDVRH